MKVVLRTLECEGFQKLSDGGSQIMLKWLAMSLILNIKLKDYEKSRMRFTRGLLGAKSCVL